MTKQLNRICPVCNSDEPEPWLRPPQSPGPVVRCGRCGFVYVTPIETMKALIAEGAVTDSQASPLLTSANAADIKGRWEEPIIESYMREAQFKRENAVEVLQRIEALKPQRGRLLDVGCFCGVFLSVAAERGWDCDGLEPLVGPSIYARSHFNLRVVTDTLRATTFPPNQFDVVTAFQVFEHLIEPDKEIELLLPMLKPGGLLVIEVPNIATPLVNILGTRHRHFVQDHVSFFSAQTLSLLMERYGLRVCQTYYPTRRLSLRHISWWLGHYGLPHEALMRRLSRSWTETSLSVGLGDIVTVIGQKP